MLRELLAKALSFRLLVLAAALVVAGIGGWTFANLPIDAYPDIAPTQVKIILKAPGMTPDEVETRILAPIEQEMLGLPKQAVLRATAKYAIADITIDFTDGTDIYWARQQVSERLAGVMGDLPAGVNGGLAPISTPLSELFMFTIDGPQSLEERRTVLDWTIRPALRTVPGVADVNALGGYVRTFEVRPDPLALGAAGLTMADVKAAVESGNRNDGAGRLANGENALIVRAVGAIKTLDDLRALVLHAPGGRVLRLGDVATISNGSLTRYGAVSADGHGETVEGLVIALRGADARKVVTGVKARLAELQHSLPPGMTINVFYDRSDLIARAVGTVEEALLEATFLVVVLLVVFLGDWRAAAIVATTPPMAASRTGPRLRRVWIRLFTRVSPGVRLPVGRVRPATAAQRRTDGQPFGVSRSDARDGLMNRLLIHGQILPSTRQILPTCVSSLVVCCLSATNFLLRTHAMRAERQWRAGVVDGPPRFARMYAGGRGIGVFCTIRRTGESAG